MIAGLRNTLRRFGATFSALAAMATLITLIWQINSLTKDNRDIERAIDRHEHRIDSLQEAFYDQQLTCQEVKHTLAYNNHQVNSMRQYCQNDGGSSD